MFTRASDGGDDKNRERYGNFAEMPSDGGTGSLIGSVRRDFFSECVSEKNVKKKKLKSIEMSRKYCK